MGCATRRLVVVLGRVRSVGGASRIPPIERHHRGFFILLFAPKDGEEQRVPQLALSLLFYPSPFPSLNRSPYVFVGTGEDTLDSGSVEVAHVFTNSATRFTATRSILR